LAYFSRARFQEQAQGHRHDDRCEQLEQEFAVGKLDFKKNGENQWHIYLISYLC